MGIVDRANLERRVSTTQLGRRIGARRMTASGHEDQFRRLGLSGRYMFS
jgi:hypothetical protein